MLGVGKFVNVPECRHRVFVHLRVFHVDRGHARRRVLRLMDAVGPTFGHVSKVAMRCVSGVLKMKCLRIAVRIANGSHTTYVPVHARILVSAQLKADCTVSVGDGYLQPYFWSGVIAHE